MIDYNKILIAFFISFVVQVTVYFFIKYLNSKGVKSNYFAKQKIHEGEVPRVGGLLFLSSFLIVSVLGVREVVVDNEKLVLALNLLQVHQVSHLGQPLLLLILPEFLLLLSLILPPVQCLQL